MNGGPQVREWSPIPGPLDLDDLCAQITEHHGAVGAGESFGKFDDPNTFEEHRHGTELYRTTGNTRRQ